MISLEAFFIVSVLIIFAVACMIAAVEYLYEKRLKVRHRDQLIGMAVRHFLQRSPVLIDDDEMLETMIKTYKRHIGGKQ